MCARYCTKMGGRGAGKARYEATCMNHKIMRGRIMYVRARERACVRAYTPKNARDGVTLHRQVALLRAKCWPMQLANTLFYVRVADRPTRGFG